MRSSGCRVQQGLTPEATSIVKHAVSLARRRGHDQVTPLHVANAMLLSSSSSVHLRRACLESHTHPLQCRALELCFNVALNRLPASMLSGAHHPSISNALIAAFKRAQAHQRRGSIEQQQHQQQQQAILAVKIEVEQLIISILDDPSVSRVMREAGFSSTLVKSKVEQAISMDDVRIEDVSSIIEGILVSGKRNKCCVVVGECLVTLQGTIKGTINRIERGDDSDIRDALTDVRFESLSLDSLSSLSRDEIELKVSQVTHLVKCYASKGLVLYLGDLRWALEFRKGGVEHVIMELKRLVLECSNGFGRLWLVGAATYHTYTTFGSGNPSLEAIWGFHAITVPAGILDLRLMPQSDSLASKTTNGAMSWLINKDGSQKGDDTKLDNNSCNSEPTSTSLPSWLQKYKDENKGLNNKSTKEDSIPVKDLCKSWSFSERTLSFSSVSPPYASEFSYDLLRSRHPALEVASKCYNPTLDGGFQTTLSMSSSPSSSEVILSPECTQKRFNDYYSWSLETLCNALENRVPWQKEIIRNVASTVLDCRSGKVRRKQDGNHSKEETWFFFLGDDVNGKEKIAKELGRLVFGSENKCISIGLSSFSSKEDSGNKRLRDEHSFTYRLIEEVLVDPHRVFFVEDLEQMDYVSQVSIKRAIERGKITSSFYGKEVSLGDAIIILSCETFRSRSRDCSPSTKNMVDHHHQKGGPREEDRVGCSSDESYGNSISSRSVSLDLNISLSDDCAFNDQDQKGHSYVDQLGLLSYVDKCILFKL